MSIKKGRRKWRRKRLGISQTTSFFRIVFGICNCAGHCQGRNKVSCHICIVPSTCEFVTVDVLRRAGNDIQLHHHYHHQTSIQWCVFFWVGLQKVNESAEVAATLLVSRFIECFLTELVTRLQKSVWMILTCPR